MYQIESVFIGESQPNHTSSQAEIKLETRNKNIVGDIIRLAPHQFKLNCIRCSKTFQHFLEFTLHIEDHFMQNDAFILHNTSMKDENFIHGDMKFDETIIPVELINECQLDSECELEHNIPLKKSKLHANDAHDDSPSKHTEIREKRDGSYESVSKKYKCMICGVYCVSKSNLKIHSPARFASKVSVVCIMYKSILKRFISKPFQQMKFVKLKIHSNKLFDR